MLRHVRRLVPLALLLLLPAACVQMEYGIVLDDDLSGTADLDISFDLERMAVAMATVQRSFTGEEGPPSEEELEAARAELRARIEEDDDFDEAKIRADAEGDLPEGVRLLDVEQTREDLKTTVHFAFAFDHVDRLRELQLGHDDHGEAGERGGKPDVGEAQPFAGLEIEVDGDELVIRNDVENPVEESRENPMVSGPMLESLFEGLRIAFRVTTPFEVVEHNATRVEGSTLWWVYDYESLSRDEAPRGIYARFRR